MLKEGLVIPLSMIKRSVYILLAVYALLVPCELAATDLIVGTDAGEPGDTVLIPVSIMNAESVTAIQFDLIFDSLDIIPGTAMPGGALSDHSVVANNIGVSTYRVVIYSPTSSILSDGPLIEIPFMIQSMLPGSTAISLTNVLMSDPDADAINPANRIDGSVDIIPLASERDVNTYLLFSQGQTTIGNNVTIYSGNVGSNRVGGAGVTLGQYSRTSNLSTLRADSISLGQPSIVGNVEANEIIRDASSEVLGVEVIGLATPLALNFPAPQNVIPGTADIRIPDETQLSLPPGVYYNLDVGSNATLNLAGGFYVFGDIRVRRGAVLSCDAVTILSVAHSFIVESYSKVNYQADPPAFSIHLDGTVDLLIGSNVRIKGLISAPSATAIIGGDSVLEGRVIAQNITIGNDSMLTFNPFDGSILPQYVIDEFSLFAQRRVAVGENSSVLGAMIGSNGITSRVIEFEERASTSATTQLVGDKVRLGTSASVGEVLTNELDQAASATLTTLNTPVSLPVVQFIPVLSSPPSSETDLFVPLAETTTIFPGIYGEIVIGNQAVVTIVPGDYSMRKLTVGDNVQLQFSGTTFLNSQYAVNIGSGVHLNTQSPAHNVEMGVSELSRVTIGDGSVINLKRLHAVNAEVNVGAGVLYNGRIWSDQLIIGTDTTISDLDLSPPVAVIDPPAGFYLDPVTVVFDLDEPGILFYTLDGSTPTSGSDFLAFNVPLEPLSLPSNLLSNTEVRWFAVDLSGNEGPVETAQFFVGSQTPVTTITPPGGIYNSPQSVTLSSSIPSVIYYTIDDTAPNTGSAVYIDPITISEDLSLRVFADAGNGGAESIQTEVYVIDTVAPITVPSPPAGTYPMAVDVALIPTDDKLPATIRFTTDGTIPTLSSPVYNTPISITQSAVIKFFARDDAGNEEPVRSAEYIIAAAPSGLDDVDNFLLFAQQTVSIGNKSRVALGNIGANGVGNGTVAVNDGVIICPDCIIISDNTQLGGMTRVGHVVTNTLNADPSAFIRGAHIPSASLPVVSTIPPVSESVIGSASIYVDPGPEYSVSPGIYKTLWVKNDAAALLTEGEYFLNKLSIATRARLSITGPVTVYVRERVKIDAESIVNELPDPERLEIRYSGSDTINIGNNSRLKCILNAPGAPVIINDYSTFEGRILAQSVSVGTRTVLAFNPMDGVTLPPPAVPESFTLFAQETLTLNQNVFIVDGKLGSNGLTNDALDVGSYAFTGESVFLYADTLTLRSYSVVGQTFFNFLNKNATAFAFSENSPLTTPVVEVFPTFDSFVSGSSGVNVGAGTTKTISPGTYRNITVNDSSTARFQPGEYSFDKLITEDNCFIDFLGPTVLNIKDQVLFGNAVEFNGQIPPQDVQVNYDGTLDFNLSRYGYTAATVVAPNALVRLKKEHIYAGAIWAKRIEIGVDSLVRGPDFTSPSTVASPDPGTFSGAQELSLVVDEVADIYYSLDGSDPTFDSLLYTGPFIVYETTSVKFFAIDLVGNVEPIQTAIYTINP